MSHSALRWCAEQQGRLSDRAQLLLLALSSAHNQQTGQCNPRVERLAALLGKDEATVHRGLSELRDAGLLRVRRRGPRSSQYDLLIPHWAPTVDLETGLPLRQPKLPVAPRREDRPPAGGGTDMSRRIREGRVRE